MTKNFRQRFKKCLVAFRGEDKIRLNMQSKLSRVFMCAHVVHALGESPTLPYICSTITNSSCFLWMSSFA